MMKQLPLLPLLSLLPLLLLFSLLTGNSSACTNAVSKVISKEGTDVILPCSPSTRENLLKKLFDWKKVGQGGETLHEVFMYDSGVQYDGIKAGQSEQFKGRVSHFQDELKHGNASIFIRKTEVIDSGSYTCVFPHLQPSEEFCIEFIVGTAAEPSVRTLGQTQDGVLLQCLVRGASPEPKLEWQDSSGHMVPAAEPQVSERGGRFYITLNATVTKADHYRCVATQKIFHHQLYAETYVPLNGAASKPYVLILEETKDRALLQCEVNGAFPKPLLQWTDSSGNMVPAAEPQVSERGGSYDVILQTTVTKTDNYSCVASQDNHQSKPAHIYVSLSGSGSHSGWIAAGVLGAGFFVVLVVLVVYCIHKRKQEQAQRLDHVRKGIMSLVV